MKTFNTVANGELTRQQIEENFEDLHPPLSKSNAVVEAARCLYCYDAPCMNACPTQINIPKFIKQIHSSDADSAAKTILSQNILGGTCARACPTEELCEEVCVVHHTEGGPVKIGELQRYAVEGLIDTVSEHPFERAPQTGVTFAVIGAGPAGLAFAHRFAMLGNNVIIFEKKPKPGGLNEYGLAEYKMAGGFAQKEIEFLLKIGGIEIIYNQNLGENLSLTTLQNKYDGIFVGIGLEKARSINIPGHELPGIENALDFINDLRQESEKSDITTGNDVVVIGGGNTAIDAAVQARCLGARAVTLAYRRGPEAMGATHWEQQLAYINGVTIHHWLSPQSFIGDSTVKAVRFSIMQTQNGKLVDTGETTDIPADRVLLAIGQEMIDNGLENLKTEHGKFVIDQTYQTSISGIYAGGDCTRTGVDLTVQAVEDGKQAAIAADQHMRKNKPIAAE